MLAQFAWHDLRQHFCSPQTLTISYRPQTLWGLTKWLAHVGAICVARSAPTFLQSPDPNYIIPSPDPLGTICTTQIWLRRLRNLRGADLRNILLVPRPNYIFPS